MNLESYIPLIQNLPWKEQAFSSKRSTWKNTNLPFDKLFQGEDTIKISRADIFSEKDDYTKVLKTIIWGYPSGVNFRGPRYFSSASESEVKNFIKELNKLKSNAPWEDHLALMNPCDKLGLATYTKLLYFFGVTVQSLPALILDQRIVNVIQDKTFSDFIDLDFSNKTNLESRNALYPEYLKTMSEIEHKLGKAFTLDQLELFLFTFGENLKNT